MAKVNHTYSLRAKFTGTGTVQVVVTDSKTNDIFVLNWYFKEDKYTAKKALMSDSDLEQSDEEKGDHDND